MPEDCDREEDAVQRPLLALALFVGAVIVTGQPASTASNTFDVASNTVSYRSVGIQNSSTRSTSLKSLGYTVALGQIKDVRPTFNGDLRGRTIRARYGNDTPVTCGSLLYSLLGLLGGSETTVTCAGLNEDADRPRALTFLIS